MNVADVQLMSDCACTLLVSRLESGHGCWSDKDRVSVR